MVEVLSRLLAAWIRRLGLRLEVPGSSAAPPLLLLWLWQMCSGFGLATLLGEMGWGGGPPSLPGAAVLAGLLAQHGWRRGGGCRGGGPGFGGSSFGWGVVRASGRGGSWDPTTSARLALAGWGLLVALMWAGGG